MSIFSNQFSQKLKFEFSWQIIESLFSAFYVFFKIWDRLDSLFFCFSCTEAWEISLLLIPTRHYFWNNKLGAYIILCIRRPDSSLKKNYYGAFSSRSSIHFGSLNLIKISLEYNCLSMSFFMRELGTFSQYCF